MKPCFSNRKQLAWLALGELDARRAEALRAHIQACPGCRGYLEEICAVKDKLAAVDTMPDVQASEAFHQRLTARLRAEQPTSLWETFSAQLAALRLSWRVALPVAGAAVILIVALQSFILPARPPAAIAPPPKNIQRVQQTDPQGDLAPTIANYQRAANRSLDDLDDLLTRQAKRIYTPARSYTASMLAVATKVD